MRSASRWSIRRPGTSSALGEKKMAGFAGRTSLKQFLAEMAGELKKNHYFRAGHETSLIYPD
jgi:hypothetical protein